MTFASNSLRHRQKLGDNFKMLAFEGALNTYWQLIGSVAKSTQLTGYHLSDFQMRNAIGISIIMGWYLELKIINGLYVYGALFCASSHAFISNSGRELLRQPS